MVVGEIDSKTFVEEMKKIIDELPGESSQYELQEVSWDDVERDEYENGKVSMWGDNISDSRLFMENGQKLFFIRSNNLNEKIAKVNAKDIILYSEKGEELAPISLDEYLMNAGMNASYAGMDTSTNLYNETGDDIVGVRLQTSFIPVGHGEEDAGDFHPEIYSYKSSEKDPQNALLLCTSQGTAVQYPSSGPTVLYHHCEHDDGKYHRHTLSAQKTRFSVGGCQRETEEEREFNESKGRASAMHLGLKHMGPRMNILMTIQVPLLQESSYRQAPVFSSPHLFGFASVYFGPSSLEVEEDESLNFLRYDDEPMYKSLGNDMGNDMSQFNFRSLSSNHGGLDSCGPPIGKATAARVNIGLDKGILPPLTKMSPVRNKEQHITVTVVIYHTITGGVPSKEDVKAAIDDMEDIYAKCKWSGRLSGEDDLADEMAWDGNSAQAGASFMKKKIVTTARPKRARFEPFPEEE